MIIGIPKEIKDNEYRVALPPNGVRELVRHGHQVVVETGAGVGSAFSDDEYTKAGATVVHSAEEAWARAEMVLKVKEPQPKEYPFLRDDLVLFTYLHLAADERQTHALIDSGVTALAYETVEDAKGQLPLLQPMSEVAGRMATQIAAHYLEKQAGGRGILMGGIPGVKPAHVVVLGGGTVGTHAAIVALGMGARVSLLDVNMDRLRYLDEVLSGQRAADHTEFQRNQYCRRDYLGGRGDRRGVDYWRTRSPADYPRHAEFDVEGQCHCGCGG